MIPLNYYIASIIIPLGEHESNLQYSLSYETKKNGGDKKDERDVCSFSLREKRIPPQ